MIDEGTEPYVGEPVQLQDQFHVEPFDALVDLGYFFCTNADKTHGGMYYFADHWSYHLTVYSLYHEEPLQVWEVTVSNQFGADQVLWVQGPIMLAVPTHKLLPDDFGPPDGLDHFLLYEVIDYTVSPDVPVDLADQLTYEPEVWVYEPVLFANPVQKTYGDVTPIQNPDWHTVFYLAPGELLDFPVEVLSTNQFGMWLFTVTQPIALGVPSAKMDWTLLE
jgi:hypothetical protein